MGKTNGSRLDRITQRPLFITATMGLAYFLGQLAIFSLRMRGAFPASPFEHSFGTHLFHIVMAIAFATLWLFSASGRLFDLRLNRLWIVFFAAPWAIVPWAV